MLKLSCCSGPFSKMSELLEPPGAEMCVFLLREEEEEERRKEVGCQWESPEERREVGCQSETAERRDAAVQVDLLSQQLSLRQTGEPERQALDRPVKHSEEPHCTETRLARSTASNLQADAAL